MQIGVKAHAIDHRARRPEGMPVSNRTSAVDGKTAVVPAGVGMP
jgi:hypothetical protein